ncbi:PhoH family protein [Mahella australiensis 50-1 BON]|uniref:PhoH-like protein n=2 Tax=Mahella TaxID=252965 RepID=F4A358_MAHA5|nr:PhoH family protein [Mahella australiensis 50-1 BON]
MVIQLNVDSMEEIAGLFGTFDENAKLIEEQTGARIVARGTELRIEGTEEEVMLAQKVVNDLLVKIQRREPIDKISIQYAIDLAKEGNETFIKEKLSDVVCVTHRGKQIKCKTIGQKAYVDAIRNNDLVFGIGPAGTGKTYLAVAMAVVAFKNKEVARIILTRPAVEAGEKLGFLPGDLQEKVDPYLRPLYDAMYDIIGVDSFQKMMERGAVEVAPLAYMRGRTLDDAFIILDEAQNTTPEQMKMFLTRMGFGSKMVVTGDITQIDLPHDKISGLMHAARVLRDVKGVEFVYLTEKDVVRHELVQRVIKAYEAYEKNNAPASQS